MVVLVALFVVLAAVVHPAAAQTYADYHLGPWSELATRLSEARSEPAIARAEGNLLYVLGGGVMQPSGGSTSRSPTRTIDCFVVDAGQLRRLNPTGACALLPEPREELSAVSYGGFLYAIGGEDRATIVKAPINADGTLGTWAPAGTLTANSSYTDSLVINNYLVVFGVGGTDRGDGTIVQRAAFLPGGNLGSWQTLNAIPAQGENRTVVLNGDIVYVLGGNSQYATVRPDGTLSVWQPIPSPRSVQPSAGVFANYLYAFGRNCTADELRAQCELRFAERAVIQSNGVITGWEQTSGWPRQDPRTGPNLDMTGLMVDRHAFFFGGFNENGGGSIQNVFATIGRSTVGQPRIRRVTPPQGSPAGGNTVEVSGFNFISASRVFVGDTEVTPTTISTGLIRMVMPAGAAGPTTIRVLNPDGEFDSALYEYAVFLPTAPLEVSAMVTGTSVHIRWSVPDSGPPTGYVLEAGVAPGRTDFAVTLGNVLEFVVEAAPGTYYVRLRAYNLLGVGTSSAEIIVVVGGALPGAPSNLRSALGLNRSVTLTWNPPGGLVSHYLIEVGSTAAGAEHGSFAVSSAGVTVAGVPAGSYFVRVRAVNGAGAGPPSNTILVVVP
jgi:hypothetical protein